MIKNHLSLFSGIGGSDIAVKYLIGGYRTIGFVEYEKYPQDVIRQRQTDGLLDIAPIFGDIRQFNQEYAEAYTGMVDLITAGFPCQPFSVAGKQQGEDDARNMWPATLECIKIVKPRYAFLENVPGLLSAKVTRQVESEFGDMGELTDVSVPYIGTILGQLSEAGYDSKWAVIGADDVGARHRRKRLWILAYSVMC